MSYQNKSKTTNALMFEKDDAMFVLASDDFSETPHIHFIENLAKRFDLDLSATTTVMKHLPLWASGTDHKLLRQDTAELLNKDRKIKVEKAELALQATFRKIMFDGAETIDMLDLIREMASDFMEQITGLARHTSARSEKFNLFSSNLGVAVRLRLEADIKIQLKHAYERFPDETDRNRAIRVGQWWMGFDALVGTLGQSVYRHLSGIGTDHLKMRPMSEIPTDAGVRLIGRVAVKDTVVSGCPVPRGQLVECYLDEVNTSSDKSQLRFFGAGKHLCLGGPLALEFFRMASRQLNKCDFGLELALYRKQDCDVFDMPSEFIVRKIVCS